MFSYQNVNLINDPDGIIVPGTIYGFGEMYFISDVLEPAKGYWIRTNFHGRRLASDSIDTVLGWIGRSGGSPTAVEIRVDPSNVAGIATAESVSSRWRGLRFADGDVEVEVDGEYVSHLCWVIPRLPLEGSK